MAKTNIVDWKTITNFVIDAFVGYGIPRADAEICADILLESDKRGIESHGVNRFKPIYLDRIKAGIQNPVTEFEVVKDFAATAVVDGHDGMGQVVGYKAMTMAIEKAKKYGMGMVVARNSCHYGIAGYYATMATDAGMIGITGTNARPSIAPTFGVENMLGTNPLTFGMPTDEEFPFVLDCATSIVQRGKIEYYARIGKDTPRLKFSYTSPKCQNPGGVTMTAERRRRLLELAHEYNFMVVEDDPYGRLRYDGGHQVPLKAMDDSVIYLGTISKMLGPGLRTGWIAAPEAVLARINLVKQGADLCGSAFDQLVVQHYFADVAWQRTLQKFIALYKERRDAMLAALDEFFPPEATWTHPAGGMFLWITLPDYMDTDSMLAEALESGVTYVPGNSFFPDGKTGRNSMRVNFSFETPESITEAIRRLAKVIEERLELYRVFIEAGALPGYDRKDAAMDENATSWKDVIVDSEQNEEAVMQAREGDAEQIEIAEEKVTEAQEAAAE